MTSPAEALRESAVAPSAAVESTAGPVGAFAALRSRPFLLFWSTIWLVAAVMLTLATLVATERIRVWQIMVIAAAAGAAAALDRPVRLSVVPDDVRVAESRRPK
jgi:hypothetical protein